VEGIQNLVDFPVLISMTETCLQLAIAGSVENTSGYDIVFYAQDGLTQLDHKIELYNNATGEFLSWVRIPILYYNTRSLHFGAFPEGMDTTDLDGIIDEVRISQVARSEDWIKTSYNNQSDPALFYTVTD